MHPATKMKLLKMCAAFAAVVFVAFIAWQWLRPGGGHDRTTGRVTAADEFYAKAVAALPEGASDVRCEKKVDGLTGWLLFTLAVGGKPVRYLAHYYSFGTDSVKFEIVRAD